MDVLRVVIADDHALFREALRQLLDGVDDVTVVGEASNGRQAVQLVAEHTPDVILMDISMPEMDGIQATELIVARHPETQVVILTMYADDTYVVHAIRAGAKGYLLKHARSDDVVRAIRLAAAGNAMLAPDLEQALLREFQRLVHGQPAVTRGDITAREREFLTLLAHGLSNQEIGAALHLTEHTVKNQLGPLYAKLGVRDRTQAVLTAMAMDLVPRPRPGASGEAG